MRTKTTNNHCMAWYREARGSNEDQSRVIKILNNKSIVFTLGKQNFREKKILTISRSKK